MEMEIGHPSSNIEFQYTDKELDEDTDLYYFQARYYDPKTNHFKGRDRVKLEDNLTNYFGINAYVFVNNNPVRNVDEDGNIPSEKTAPGTIRSSFGMRMHPILNVMRLHAGMDISNGQAGGEIKAGARGRVSATGFQEGGAGNYAVINHGAWDGYKLETVYMHMQNSASQYEGVLYGNGDSGFGAVGSTGVGTGPHLHYEIRINGKSINPEGRDAQQILNTLVERSNIHNKMKDLRNLQNKAEDLDIKKQYEEQIQKLLPEYKRLTTEINSL
jgi:RHS repeat-associated protein